MSNHKKNRSVIKQQYTSYFWFTLFKFNLSIFQNIYVKFLKLQHHVIFYIQPQ